MITVGLDEKQNKTYSAICSSFLLWGINKKGDYIEDKQQIENEVARSLFKTTTNKDVRNLPLIQKMEVKGSTRTIVNVFFRKSRVWQNSCHKNHTIFSQNVL